MKLRRMEITGFKSFSDKASIEFPAGVSAIVGPNGCGKSNIVDALKWAMGEQSVRQLRGKSMEDVIFAGTEGKPPLNLAEVSLVLSNENGDAPEELKDYAEIMVTRRLFRSGESAYLINKQPCRLKDITNIFLGSGMGAKSYAVIQQGNIGAITDAGPEERRFYIEEAAGITRYKQRKTEALRKIEATDQNLLRVTDIISEVERQMNSLNRQAKKAEQYKDYQERIRKADVLLALHYYDDYSRQIEAAAKQIMELKDADIRHLSKIRELDASVEDIKLKRWQKNEEISAQKADKFRMQRDIDKMENDIGHLRKDSERLVTEIGEFQAAYKELDEKNKTILSEVAEIEQQYLHFKEKIEATKTEIEKETLDSQVIRDKLAALNRELEAAKTNLANLTAQEAQYRNIHQNSSNNKESLKRRLKRIDEEEFLANQKAAEFQNAENKAKEELKICKEEVEDLNVKIRALQENLKEKSQSLGSQIKQVQILETDRSKTRSRYSALKKMEDSFEWYKGGVKAIMTRNDSSVLGLMADIIEPQPGFESAVEAVLGEALQYILVKNQDAAAEAIAFLQAETAGRSGFIPLSSLKSLGNPSKTKVRPLLDYVTVKPGFESVSEAILGNVAVAENMEKAIALYNADSDFRTVVTQSGDMISHQGVMVGGSQENLSGILAKKQELKELERLVASLDQQVEDGRKAQKALEVQVRSLEADLQTQFEEKSRAVQDETDAERAVYKVTEELKHARRHLEVVHSEQEQLLDEENGIEEELEKYNKILAEVQGELKAAQDKVTGITENIQAVSAETEAFNQRVVDLRLRLTTFNAQSENSSNTLRRLKQFQEDGLTRLDQLSKDILLKEQKRAAGEQKTAEYAQQLAQLYEAIKTLDNILQENETDYQSIDAVLKESDTSVSDIKTQREKILENIRVLELELSQKEIRRENIASQFAERQNKSLEEFRHEWEKESQEISAEKTEAELAEYRKKIAAIGDVNLGAIEEYRELKERFDFLGAQKDDLVKAIEELHKVIKKINKISQERFLETFNLVNEKLKEVFPRLFDGGSASLVLTDPNDPLETGVEFMVHPPGKKLTRLSLLSGGEKALSAIAFVFSIFLIKPASFCIMDEIDAPLDEANVFRFNELLKIIGEKSQIIMITHKKRSMEFADTLFGVTMEKKGVSKIVSVNFEKQGEC